ncbi:hypothetical protein E4U61_004324 [Claviceps capensis]|nr:hypothetical protein E4U61_004324 [Claviceps capensis]
MSHSIHQHDWLTYTVGASSEPLLAAVTPLVVDGQNTVVLDFPGSGSRPARFFPGIRRSRMMQVFCHFKRVHGLFINAPVDTT